MATTVKGWNPYLRLNSSLGKQSFDVFSPFFTWLNMILPGTTCLPASLDHLRPINERYDVYIGLHTCDLNNKIRVRK